MYLVGMKATKEDKVPFETVLPAKYVKALRKVQGHIRDNPKSFVMDTWGDVEASRDNVCKTVGCICGWMAILTAKKAAIKPVLTYAEKIALTDRAANEARTAAAARECDLAFIAALNEQDDSGIQTLTAFIEEYKDAIPQEFVRIFDKLFHLESWPNKFRKQDLDGYRWTTTPAKAIKRIDHFLEHGR